MNAAIGTTVPANAPSGVAIRGQSIEWRAQFRGLQGRPPYLWPFLPRLLCALVVMAMVLLAGWRLLWLPQSETLAAAAQQEQRLREEFARNAGRARDLDRLRRHRAVVQAQVELLERQLPGRAEMDALLAEINQAGLERGLQFELFKPGKEQLFEYYAELPIDIKLTGSFHALAGFASDVANLSRIVILDRIAISAGRETPLSFEGVARTFRYIDGEELAARARTLADEKKRNAR
jgi:type IV pilus assembly protein PilO